MRKLLTSIILVILLAFSVQAHALSITPGSEVLTGDQTSQDVIDAVIKSMLGTATELYKKDVEPLLESGFLAGSYETVFSNTTEDPSEAKITYTGGLFVGVEQFLLVKDGNHVPAWYLFNLTDLGWNGTDELDLSGFWPEGGAISHVTLYGTASGTTPVPEPGTFLLLGAGLLGLGFYGRKRMKS